jgi:DNA-binding LytR/AlgR family response regulator
MPTALIADDEPLLADQLQRKLAQLWPELEIRAIVSNGRAAIAQPPADLSALLAQLAVRLQPQTSDYLSWVRAGVGDTVRLIAIEDMLFFQAGDKYTRVVTRTGEAWIRTPIKELATTLDPARFWQVHRATLVNVHEIAAMERTNRDSGELQLKDYPERLDVSRGFLHLFRQM